MVFKTYLAPLQWVRFYMKERNKPSKTNKGNEGGRLNICSHVTIFQYRTYLNLFLPFGFFFSPCNDLIHMTYLKEQLLLEEISLYQQMCLLPTLRSLKHQSRAIWDIGGSCLKATFNSILQIKPILLQSAPSYSVSKLLMFEKCYINCFEQSMLPSIKESAIQKQKSVKGAHRNSVHFGQIITYALTS